MAGRSRCGRSVPLVCIHRSARVQVFRTPRDGPIYSVGLVCANGLSKSTAGLGSAAFLPEAVVVGRADYPGTEHRPRLLDRSVSRTRDGALGYPARLTLGGAAIPQKQATRTMKSHCAAE